MEGGDLEQGYRAAEGLLAEAKRLMQDIDKAKEEAGRLRQEADSARGCVSLFCAFGEGVLLRRSAALQRKAVVGVIYNSSCNAFIFYCRVAEVNASPCHLYSLRLRQLMDSNIKLSSCTRFHHLLDSLRC